MDSRVQDYVTYARRDAHPRTLTPQGGRRALTVVITRGLNRGRGRRTPLLPLLSRWRPTVLPHVLVLTPKRTLQQQVATPLVLTSERRCNQSRALPQTRWPALAPRAPVDRVRGPRRIYTSVLGRQRSIPSMLLTSEDVTRAHV